MAHLDELPDLVLSHMADFLGPEDTTRLAQTCHHLHSILPRYLVMRGDDFTIHGPSGGHWAPELYFDGPPLADSVKKLTMSLSWVDQGWGNRKGEIFLKLMRPKQGAASNKREVIAEKRGIFGVAKHEREEVTTELTDSEPVVALAQPGDFYRFMRNAGGGGGHKLTVKDFRVVACLKSF